MLRPLNSDELGGKGEAEFERMCFDARLIPNKCTRDRTGWDYIVEWPTVENASLSRDRQPAALATLIQVKSVWESTEFINVRLSSIERLVKDPRPSFIVILRFNTNLNLIGLNVVHVRHDFSANVLKKLRKAHAESRPVNKVRFSFGIAKWSEPIEIKGVAFCRYVESQVLAELSQYGSKKSTELNSLGMAGGSLETKFTFRVESEEELFDGLLGLRTLEASISETIETRFGIPLPVFDLPAMDGKVSFAPEPSCQCDLIFQKSFSAIPLKFAADMFVLPSVVKSHNLHKALLKSDFFTLTVKADLQQEPVKTILSLKFDNEVFSVGRFKVQKLRDFHQLIYELSEGELSLELRPSNEVRALVGTVAASPSANFARYAKHIVRLCDIVSEMAVRAGVNEQYSTISDLVDNEAGLSILEAWFSDPSTLSPLSFTTEKREGIENGMGCDMLFILHLNIDETTFAYGVRANCRAEIDGEVVTWGSTEMQFLSIRSVQNSQEGMDDFVKSLKSQTGIQSHIASNICDKN